MADERFFADPRLSFAEGRFSRQSTRTFKPHMHRCFSIGAVEEGEILYRADGQCHRLRPGGFALINPETLHACNHETAAPRSYFMLYLQTDWCLRVQQSLWRVERFVPVRRPLLEDTRLYEHFRAAMACLMVPGPLLAKEQQLLELMEAVFVRACNPGEPARPASQRVEQLRDRLAADLAADLTLECLATEMGANACTLIRQFKEATGITPHAYRTNCRIDHARHLLRQGRDIAETALECGFFDQSHFHRHFKAMTTVTPREYQVNFVQ
ncbi:AraC family transcriptional regulator [Desulfobulbus elongatus]|uniref:AraC family transcriptional regulator n=1 Tax=Desulfobulbus elongatus TaxID=53332 RepID=UPI00048270CD|nr:AraC family transcriptional regulator [Desulfobulbus elongatus]